MQIDSKGNILDELEKEFGSFIEPDIEERNVPPLHNRFEQVVDLKHEKPEHRLIAVLKTTGMSNIEIAEHTGYTPLHVSTVCKQPWVERFILEKTHGQGDAAMAKLQAAAVQAAERLIFLAENAKNEECKRKANNDILDRKYGKPNQPYTVAHKQADEMADSELAKIAQGN